MSVDRGLFLAGSITPPAPNVPRKRGFFHPPVNPSLFECFQRGRLGMRQARLDATFGENPTAFSSLHQQEFDDAHAHAVANCSDLLACFQLAQLRQSNELRRQLKRPDLRPPDGQSRFAILPALSSHSSRVHDARRF